MSSVRHLVQLFSFKSRSDAHYRSWTLLHMVQFVDFITLYRLLFQGYSLLVVIHFIKGSFIVFSMISYQM